MKTCEYVTLYMSHHIMNTFFNLKNTKKTLKQQTSQTLHYIYIYIYIYIYRGKVMATYP